MTTHSSGQQESSQNQETRAPSCVWIVGGAGHFGSSLAAAISRRGERVVCFDLERRPHEMVERLGLGDNVTPVSLDVGDTKETVRILGNAWEQYGPARGFVFLPAKSSRAAAWDQVTEEQFDSTVRFNLTATYIAVREVGRRMVQQGHGSIVLIASMYGVVAPDLEAYQDTGIPPNPLDYGASKAGVVQMGKYLSASLGPHGVRCNVVSPGPFPHPGAQQRSSEFIRRLGKKTHLRRIGVASEIVGPVLFLLSDEASFVTGHNLMVDGGWTAS